MSPNSKNPQHQSLAQGRWYSLSLSAQLANIGSEFSRAYKNYFPVKTARFEGAFLRLDELLRLTLNNPALTFPQRKEIARLKETLYEGFFGNTPSKTHLDPLHSYFNHFAIWTNTNKSSSFDELK
jgi:hypothetical protein